MTEADFGKAFREIKCTSVLQRGFSSSFWSVHHHKCLVSHGWDNSGLRREPTHKCLSLLCEVDGANDKSRFLVFVVDSPGQKLSQLSQTGDNHRIHPGMLIVCKNTGLWKSRKNRCSRRSRQIKHSIWIAVIDVWWRYYSLLDARQHIREHAAATGEENRYQSRLFPESQPIASGPGNLGIGLSLQSAANKIPSFYNFGQIHTLRKQWSAVTTWHFLIVQIGPKWTKACNKWRSSDLSCSDGLRPPGVGVAK